MARTRTRTRRSRRSSIYPPPLDVGAWAGEDATLPYALQAVRGHWGPFGERQIGAIRRAFYQSGQVVGAS